MLKDDVLEVITQEDHVTFAGLANRFGTAFGPGGEHALELRPNLILWANMNPPGIDAVRELLHEGKIVAVPTVMLVYLCDGARLTLPLAKNLRAYAQPRWLPVVLRPATSVTTRNGKYVS